MLEFLWPGSSKASRSGDDVQQGPAPPDNEGVPEQAAVLATDSPPGDYVMHGVFSRRPLSRDEVREALLHHTGDAVDVTRHFTVSPP